MTTPGIPSSSAPEGYYYGSFRVPLNQLNQLPARVAEWEQSLSENQANPDSQADFKALLDEGNAMIFDLGQTACLYHKCIKDPTSQQFKEISLDNIKIYRLEEDLNNPNFSPVLFRTMQAFFNENGYKCECNIVKEFEKRENIELIKLKWNQ